MSVRYDDGGQGRADINFMMEMLASTAERGLLKALQENPDDGTARNAYTDYLLENGRAESAEKVRKGYVPGVRLSAPAVLTSGAINIGQVASGALFSGAIGSGQIRGWFPPPGGLSSGG